MQVATAPPLAVVKKAQFQGFTIKAQRAAVQIATTGKRPMAFGKSDLESSYWCQGEKIPSGSRGDKCGEVMHGGTSD
jgi:hypothetical protein